MGSWHKTYILCHSYICVLNLITWKLTTLVIKMCIIHNLTFDSQLENYCLFWEKSNIFACYSVYSSAVKSLKVKLTKQELNFLMYGEKTKTTAISIYRLLLYPVIYIHMYTSRPLIYTWGTSLYQVGTSTLVHAQCWIAVQAYFITQKEACSHC